MNGTNIAQSRVLWHDSTFGKSLERPHVHNRFKSLQIRGDSAPDQVPFLLLLMLNIDSKMPSIFYHAMWWWPPRAALLDRLGTETAAAADEEEDEDEYDKCHVSHSLQEN